jgi:hypothetical protein
MRSVLESPVDPEAMALATQVVERIYAAHEAGHTYDESLAMLGKLVGKSVMPHQVHMAFGSVSPQSFAHDLLLHSAQIPSDLSDSEMLELLQHVLRPSRGELRTSFWLACIKENTGDPRVSDLIYWPGEYFGDGDNRRTLSAHEILQTAKAHGSRGNGT